MKLTRKKYKPLTKPTKKIKEQYRNHLFMKILWKEEVEQNPYLADIDFGPSFFILS